MLDLSDPLGIARIRDDDGHTLTFRRPRWRDLEELRILQMEIIAKTRQLRDEVQRWAEEHKDEQGNLPADLVDAKVHEVNRHQFGQIAGWWQRAIELLGDGDWPENWEDWPAWMIEGAGCIDQLVRYWRTVPLDRGPTTPKLSTTGQELPAASTS